MAEWRVGTRGTRLYLEREDLVVEIDGLGWGSFRVMDLTHSALYLTDGRVLPCPRWSSPPIRAELSGDTVGLLTVQPHEFVHQLTGRRWRLIPAGIEVEDGTNRWLLGGDPQPAPEPDGWVIDTVAGGQIHLPRDLPCDARERQAVEAIIRHGELTEADLSRELGTRRVGGLMERLLDKLARAGHLWLVSDEPGAQGRRYKLLAERLPDRM